VEVAQTEADALGAGESGMTPESIPFVSLGPARG